MDAQPSRDLSALNGRMSSFWTRSCCFLAIRHHEGSRAYKGPLGWFGVGVQLENGSEEWRNAGAAVKEGPAIFRVVGVLTQQEPGSLQPLPSLSTRSLPLPCSVCPVWWAPWLRVSCKDTAGKWQSQASGCKGHAVQPPPVGPPQELCCAHSVQGSQQVRLSPCRTPEQAICIISCSLFFY